ncbi:hypothetical protein EVAR_97731_1 [Eumeta japonica]|uniref:Uncharacterized protein n=1 Tax=Eumeta variegata TaxID=151549 RepID=A0A4C1XA68_EUMVA|nr:hypothetical protein EVAR_97731_1 [Eumeta japonica]
MNFTQGLEPSSLPPDFDAGQGVDSGRCHKCNKVRDQYLLWSVHYAVARGNHSVCIESTLPGTTAEVLREGPANERLVRFRCPRPMLARQARAEQRSALKFVMMTIPSPARRLWREPSSRAAFSVEEPPDPLTGHRHIRAVAATLLYE